MRMPLHSTGVNETRLNLFNSVPNALVVSVSLFLATGAWASGHPTIAPVLGTGVSMADGATLVKVGANTEWLSFEILPGGRILVPQQSNNQVIEYDQDWREIWQTTNAPSVWHATRLKNGNTLVSGNQHAFVVYRTNSEPTPGHYYYSSAIAL